MANSLLATKNILIVEDDDANRLLLEITLEELGCSFQAAVNGQEAVEKVKQGKFDLIFMDVRMPIMNGYEATAAIRQIDAQIPILALTAHAMKGVEQKCLEAGMNSYVLKPYEHQKIRDLILQWSPKP